RVRSARERVSSGERVDQARLAYVRAPGKCDLDASHFGKCRQRAGGSEETPFGREQFTAGFDLFGGELHRKTIMSHRPAARHDEPRTLGSVFFFEKSPFNPSQDFFKLSSNSILAPFLRMITAC